MLIHEGGPFIFRPMRKVLGELPTFRQDEVRREPMVFAADFAGAIEMGGPITVAFMRFLDPKKAWVIDSKTVMLMEGMYPCIPGWHHDDVPRNTPDGQPNYMNPDYLSSHVMAIVGEGSQTEYVDQEVTLPPVEGGRIIYQVWDRVLDAMRPRVYTVPYRQVLGFEWSDLHRGTKAVKNGWRFFIRASTNTRREVKNERRTQVQVYMDDASRGW